MEALGYDCACGQWAGAGAVLQHLCFLSMFLAHRCASQQRDHWVLTEDGSLVLGMGHLAGCVHAHLHPQFWMDLVHISSVLGST